MDYDYDHEMIIYKGDINSSFEIDIYDNDTHAFENERFALCIRKGELMDTIVVPDKPCVAIITIMDSKDGKCLFCK